MSIYNNNSFSSFSTFVKALVQSLYNDVSFDDFPEPPPTMKDLVDNDGEYLVDNDGKFLVVEN